MDGASTDGSADIIRKYEPWLSYWVSEPDKGQSNAINKGFEQATGDILAWINSDDTYEKDALSSIITFMVKNPKNDVVYGNAKIVNEAGWELAQMRTIPFNARAFLYNTIHIPVQSAVFWRREIFLKVGGIDEDLGYAMDVALLVKFIEAGANFGFLREFLGTYRCHGESKTFSASPDKPEDESLKIEAIAKVRTKPEYKFLRFLYRLRQMFFLTIQGDLPYILSRILARIRRQKSYEAARDGYKN
jgi:glycosyltransferase involved in cell wall biosynthesis